MNRVGLLRGCAIVALTLGAWLPAADAFVAQDKAGKSKKSSLPGLNGRGPKTSPPSTLLPANPGPGSGTPASNSRFPPRYTPTFGPAQTPIYRTPSSGPSFPQGQPSYAPNAYQQPFATYPTNPMQPSFAPASWQNPYPQSFSPFAWQNPYQQPINPAYLQNPYQQLINPAYLQNPYQQSFSPFAWQNPYQQPMNPAYMQNPYQQPMNPAFLQSPYQPMFGPGYQTPYQPMGYPGSWPTPFGQPPFSGFPGGGMGPMSFFQRGMGTTPPGGGLRFMS